MQIVWKMFDYVVVTDNSYVPVVLALNAFHANPGRAEAFVVRSDANL